MLVRPESNSRPSVWQPDVQLTEPPVRGLVSPGQNNKLATNWMGMFVVLHFGRSENNDPLWKWQAMGTNQLNLSEFPLPQVQKILFSRLLLNLAPRVLSLDPYNEVKDDHKNFDFCRTWRRPEWNRVLVESPTIRLTWLISLMASSSAFSTSSKNVKMLLRTRRSYGVE